MKTVFRNQEEVCKAWAENKQSYGRGGNISFQDDVIYSYDHWPFAKLYPSKKVVLFRNEKYSHTTSRHQTRAYYAAHRLGYKIFAVANIAADHKINIRHYLDKLKDTVLKFDRSIFYGRQILEANQDIYDELKNYCETFGLKMPITLGLYLNPKHPFIAKRFIETPTGELFIPKWLAKKGIDNVESKDILRTRNAEIRREIIRRIGIERICFDLKAQIIDKQDEYELVLLDLKDGRVRPFLKMHNPSVPEIWHIEGVHPAIKTVQDALNYRRYGTDVFVDIEDMLDTMDLTWFAKWDKRRELGLHPELRQIKPEYQTDQLNWNPEQLS